MSTQTATGSASGATGSGRIVVQAWLASRGLIFLVALLLSITNDWQLSGMLHLWDVEHFANLARNGYLGRPDGTLMAFFPGLPGLLRLGLAVGLPVSVTGVVVAAVGSAAAAAALLRLGGPWAAVAWLFAPTAVFTAIPYTESLFCALAFWAWERGRADRWAAAALLAAGACTVRVSGLFLVGALLVMIITRADTGWLGRARRALWLLIPAAALAAFMVYLYSLTGSWSAWYGAQATGWARALTSPWDALWHTVVAATPGATPDHPLWPPVFAAEIVSMAVGLLVTVWCLFRRMWAEASWIVVQLVAFSISYWYMSVNRAILLWFPLWIMLAQWGTWQPRRPVPRVVHRVLVITAFALSTALMVAWSWLYFTGNWAS